MATNVIIIMYVLAGLCFILGAIALMMQKTYIDKQTNQPTEIEIPILGKLKTNYPSLVFVVIGGVLAAIPWYKESPVQPPIGKEQWVITGAFLAPPGETLRWETGIITILPKVFEAVPYPNGTFQIIGTIPKDKKIEDMVSAINYTNGKFSSCILVSNEYKKFKEGKASVIETEGDTCLKLKPVALNRYE